MHDVLQALAQLLLAFAQAVHDNGKAAVTGLMSIVSFVFGAFFNLLMSKRGRIRFTPPSPRWSVEATLPGMMRFHIECQAIIANTHLTARTIEVTRLQIRQPPLSFHSRDVPIISMKPLCSFNPQTDLPTQDKYFDLGPDLHQRIRIIGDSENVKTNGPEAKAIERYAWLRVSVLVSPTRVRHFWIDLRKYPSLYETSKKNACALLQAIPKVKEDKPPT